MNVLRRIFAMNVSLKQAIEIHATALKKRQGLQAPGVARARADHCAKSGDGDGEVVWLKVAEVAQALLDGDFAPAVERRAARR